MDADETKEPADGRRQTPGRVIPLIVHLAVSALARPSGDRAHQLTDVFTVSQSSPVQQARSDARLLRR